jgi:hypothetical protein
VATALLVPVVTVGASPYRATVTSGAQAYAIPVPPWSLRTSSRPGSATYLAILPSVRGTLANGAESSGWRYVEQMGAGHLLECAGARLYVTEQRTHGVFVELRYDVLTVE